ncbi:MAG: hypothetical protein HY731_10630, partial [Candidatus Tectomicrobia bacterium]|nr:hypothetical protein [Candidatus Tectomicrobia bacterium]
AVITLAVEHGVALYLAVSTIIRGWTLVEQGQQEEGIGQMQQGLAALEAMRERRVRAFYLAELGEVYGKGGQIEQGLAVINEALAMISNRDYEAEMHRIKGDLLRRQKAKGKRQKAKIEAEVEACFHQAIEIARRQQAKSLELRAAMSMSRLWQRQGKKAEARKMLAEVYGWFTEGFDTADLKEAKELLEELERDHLR